MYLLDTHILLWTLDEFNKLSPTVSDILRNDKNIYVSIVSFWEIAIKKSINKLDFKRSMKELEEVCNSLEFKILPIHPKHLDKVVDLPTVHNDPFDRLLIAQAQEENLTLITKDTLIQKYNVKTLW